MAGINKAIIVGNLGKTPKSAQCKMAIRLQQSAWQPQKAGRTNKQANGENSPNGTELYFIGG